MITLYAPNVHHNRYGTTRILTSHRTSIVVRFMTSTESCEVSIRQNKTLYKRLLNMSAKMEQTESIMKIYFQLCRGAAHFRCLMQTHPQKKETYSPAWAYKCKGNKKTSFRNSRMKFFTIKLSISKLDMCHLQPANVAEVHAVWEVRVFREHTESVTELTTLI